MQIAYPCTSLFMMFALERFGRKITATTAFVLAGVFAVGFANAATDTTMLVVGFCMIFFIQLAGNSMQIFAPRCSRPMRAPPVSASRRVPAGWRPPSSSRAFCGCRPATANAVFVCVAIAAGGCRGAVNLIAPETRGLSLDEIAPPEG